MIAVPSFGPAEYVPLLSSPGLEVRWIEPSEGALSPGLTEVATAIESGAKGVLLAPVAGPLATLPAIAELCSKQKVLLALDLRQVSGSRMSDQRLGALGDFVLLSTDGEPPPSVCPGAILAGESKPPTIDSQPRGLGLRWALSVLLSSLRDEPRIRAWTGHRLNNGRSTLGLCPSVPPAWSVAAAAAHLKDADARAVQRTRHGRSLRAHCANVPALCLLPTPPGSQPAGGSLPVLAVQGETMRAELAAQGVWTLPIPQWLAPVEERGERAQEILSSLLLLPLHPYYRNRELRWLAESMRRSSLRVHGTGWSDPSEEPAVPHAD